MAIHDILQLQCRPLNLSPAQVHNLENVLELKIVVPFSFSIGPYCLSLDMGTAHRCKLWASQLLGLTPWRGYMHSKTMLSEPILLNNK